MTALLQALFKLAVAAGIVGTPQLLMADQTGSITVQPLDRIVHIADPVLAVDQQHPKAAVGNGLKQQGLPFLLRNLLGQVLHGTQRMERCPVRAEAGLTLHLQVAHLPVRQQQAVLGGKIGLLLNALLPGRQKQVTVVGMHPFQITLNRWTVCLTLPQQGIDHRRPVDLFAAMVLLPEADPGQFLTLEQFAAFQSNLADQAIKLKFF